MNATPRKKNTIPTAENAARLTPFPLWEIHHPEEPAYGLLARTIERSLPGTLSARLFDLGVYGGHSVTKASLTDMARICEADPAALEHSTPRSLSE